ncbi:MAG: hypothetical protein IJX99_10440 [Clostridia bacterium]|nr:hypothetical protein [Clostridia bacterium]MBQ8300243.1 hypothetical protein [Clostridia bacterium]
MKKFGKIISVISCIFILFTLSGCEGFIYNNSSKEEILDNFKTGKYEVQNESSEQVHKIEFYGDNVFLVVSGDMDYVGTYDINEKNISCKVQKKSGTTFATENVDFNIELVRVDNNGIKFDDAYEGTENFLMENETYTYCGEFESRLKARNIMQEENNHIVSVFYNNSNIWDSGDFESFCFVDLNGDTEKELLVQYMIDKAPTTFVYECDSNKIEKISELDLDITSLSKYSDSNGKKLFVNSYDTEISDTEECTIVKELTFGNNNFNTKDVFSEKRTLTNAADINGYEEWIFEYFVENISTKQGDYINAYKNYFDKLTKEDLIVNLINVDDWRNENKDKRLEKLNNSYGK